MSGAATLSGLDDLVLGAGEVINQSVGILIWGHAGAYLPFAGGRLCVESPTRFPTVELSGGSPPPAVDCSGSFSVPVSQTYLAANSLAGDVLHFQFWSRDAGLPPPNGVGLTRGVQVRVCP